MNFQSVREAFAPILKDFLEAYIAKDPNLSNKDWLKVQLSKQALGIAETKVQEYCESIVGAVDGYNASLQSLHQSAAEGKTPEEWLENKLVIQGKMGEKELGYVSNAMEGNFDVLSRNMNAQELNVDAVKSAEEYVGERYCMDSFNSAAEGNNYYAQVDEGGEGTVYGRNQFDLVVIDRRTGKTVDNYMVKFGKTSNETIDMIASMSKAGVKYVVPQEQMQEVKTKLPNTSICDRLSVIGQNLAQPLTKNIIEKAMSGELLKDGKSYLKAYQKKGFEGLAKKAVADIMTVATSQNGIFFNEKNYTETSKGLVSSETGKLLQTLLDAGDVTGVKVAASGAMTTYVKKGLTKVLPKNTPVKWIANIASAGVDIAGNFINVATGKMTVKEAMKETVCNQLVSIGETLIGAMDKKWLTVPLQAIPVVGPYLSMAVTSGLLESLGDKVGINFKAILKSAKPLIKSVGKILGINRKKDVVRVVSKEVARLLV